MADSFLPNGTSAESGSRFARSTAPARAELERGASEKSAQEVLTRSVAQLRTPEDLSRFLQKALRECLRASGAVSGAVFVYHAPTDTVRQATHVLRGETLDVEQDERVAMYRSVPAKASNAWRILGSEQRLYWLDYQHPDPDDWPQSKAFHDKHGHRFVACVPLTLDGLALGFLGLAFDRSEAVQPDEARLAQCWALADQVVLALRLSDLIAQAEQATRAREQEQAAQERAAELAKANAALQDVTDALATAQTMDEIVPAMLDIVARAFGIRTAAYYAHLPGPLVRLRYWRLSEGRVLIPAELMALDPVGQHAVPRALAEGFTVPPSYLGTPVHQRTRAVLIDHRAGTSRPDFDEWTLANGWEMELNVPLVVGEEAVGALVLYRSADQTYTPTEITLAEALAKQLALAVEMARLAEGAREAAIAQEQEQAAQERAAELARANEALRRTAARLVQQPDLGAFLNYLLLEVAEQTKSLGVALFLYDEETNCVRMQNFIYDSAVLDIATDELLAIWREPIPMVTRYWDLLTSGPQYLVDQLGPDSPSWPPSIPWHHGMGHRTILSVPLLLGQRPIGFLSLGFSEALDPAPENVELARALAQQATLALELTRLAEADKQATVVREQAAELAKANLALSRSISRVSSNGELASFLDSVLQEAIASSGATSASIFLYDGMSGVFRHANHNLRGEAINVATDARVALFQEPVPAATGPSWQISLHHKKIVWTDYYQLQQEEWPGAKEWHLALGYRYVATVPMLQGDEVIGFLGLAFDQSLGRQPDEFRLELCRTLASQAALAVKLTRLAEQGRQTAEQAATLVERARIAAEIHDGLQQLLLGAKLWAGVLESQPETESARRSALTNLQTMLDRAVLEARRTVQALRPEGLSGSQGLLAGLEDLARHTTTGRMQCRFVMIGEIQELPSRMQDQLYRIAQEGVSNAVKHSGALQIRVDLCFTTGAVMLTVTDDGRGADPATVGDTGYGIKGAEKRARSLNGRVEARTKPGEGFSLRAIIPINFQ